MRPRPGGRGELVVGRYAVDSMDVLQCGHDPEAVESIGTAVAACRSGEPASMRPRPGGRGESLRRRRRRSSRTWSFNAATTRRPWRRPARTLRRVPAAAGFNAATTRRPWRGRPRPSPLRAVRSALQCGHDPEAVESVEQTDALLASCWSFNAATTRRPWRAPTASPCRRPRESSFNAATTRRPWRACSAASAQRRWLLASMRPRPGGRGERPFRLEQFGNRLNASMRPRPGGRGEHCDCTRSTEGKRVLQCGHDPEAVESDERRSPNSPCRRLQCGHDPEAVESTRASVPRPRCAMSFNAATTRRPWRASSAASWATGPRTLQCGHDPEAVENWTAV